MSSQANRISINSLVHPNPTTISSVPLPKPGNSQAPAPQGTRYNLATTPSPAQGLLEALLKDVNKATNDEVETITAQNKRLAVNCHITLADLHTTIRSPPAKRADTPMDEETTISMKEEVNAL